MYFYYPSLSPLPTERGGGEGVCLLYFSTFLLPTMLMPFCIFWRR